MIRPFRLGRDIGQVARLLERAFGPEIDDDRLRTRDIVALRLASPILALAGLVSPAARDAFAGFVWIESGRIGGNISVSRLAGDTARWLIGNVAVDPSLQGRGIGRMLTNTAIDEIRRRGGSLAVLDVRQNNQPAYHLYESLGFRSVDSTIELRGSSWPGETVPDDVRPVRFADWKRLWWLKFEATPIDLQVLTPVKETAVAASVVAAELGIAGRLFSGAESRILGISERRDLVGVIEVELHGAPEAHRVRFTVRPSARGQVETKLVAAALGTLGSHPGPVRAEVRATDRPLVEALRAAGFRETRNLTRMVLDLTVQAAGGELH